MVKTDKYHGIVFGGGDAPVNAQPVGGIFRQPAPYKLRTIGAEAGYNIKAIDYGQEFSSEQLNQVLKNLVTKETLFVGISCQHFAPSHLESPMFKIYNAIFKFRKSSGFNYQIAMGGMKAVLLQAHELPRGRSRPSSTKKWPFNSSPALTCRKKSLEWGKTVGEYHEPASRQIRDRQQPQNVH